jgi:hypothetical protein
MAVPKLKLYEINTGTTFDVSSSIFGEPQDTRLLFSVPNLNVGKYKLWVENGYGPSNQVDFEVFETSTSASTITENKNIEAESLARLVEQYQLKQGVRSLIKAYITGQIQDLEVVYNDLLTRLNIPKSTGVQLDNIGQILNTSRNGQSDVNYTVILKGKIAALLSKGRIEDIAFTYAQLTGAFTIEVEENYPASISIASSTAPIPGTESIVRQILEEAIAVGVGFAGARTSNPTSGFRFSKAIADNDPPYIDINHGFGGVNNPGQGGEYQKLIF